jgi:GAF domain-containing protein
MDATPTPPPPDELAQALAELTKLLLATPDLEHLLHEVARLATGVINPPADCGITLCEREEPFTVATSSALAAHVDEQQYAVGDGPCLQALRTGRTVSVTDLAREQRWDGYPAHALSYGVRSSLSLPLTTEDGTRGALNLYATVPDAFHESARRRATLFAAHACGVLTLVSRQTRQIRLSDQLREALASRSVIDQAIGILMDQQHCDAHQAFMILRDASQHRNKKLSEVAALIITAVSGSPPVAPTSFNEPH